MGRWKGRWVGGRVGTPLGLQLVRAPVSGGTMRLRTYYLLLTTDQVLVVRVEHDRDGHEVEAELQPMILGDDFGHLELRVRLGDDDGENIKHGEQHLRCTQAQARGTELQIRGTGSRARCTGLQDLAAWGCRGLQGGCRAASRHVDADAYDELDGGNVVEGREVVHPVGHVAAAEPLEQIAQPAAVVLLVPGNSVSVSVRVGVSGQGKGQGWG